MTPENKTVPIMDECTRCGKTWDELKNLGFKNCPEGDKGFHYIVTISEGGTGIIQMRGLEGKGTTIPNE